MTLADEDMVLTREEHTVLRYEYERYCMYCFEPVTFEAFVKRKKLSEAKNDAT